VTSILRAALARRLALIAAVGAACALLSGAVGAALIRARLGGSAADSFAAVEAEVRRRLDSSAEALAQISERVAASRELIRAAPHDVAAAPALFDALGRAVPDELNATTGVTVYDAGRTPIAWAGRVFEFPTGHPDDPSSVFVQVDPFGPRLVRIEALVDRDRPVVARPPLIVSEQRLGDVRSVPGEPATFLMQTRLAPVTMTVRDAAAPPPDTPDVHSFLVHGAGGQVLLRATVSKDDVDRTRTEWRQWVRGVIAFSLAITLLVAAAAVLDQRRLAATCAAMMRMSLLLAALLVAARLVLLAGGPLLTTGEWLSPPLDLGFTALLLLSLAWLALDLLDRFRVAGGRRRPLDRAVAWTIGGFLLAGAVTGAVLVTYAGFLRSVAARASFDVLHFSLHPFDPGRVTAVAGLVLLHAGVLWGVAVATRSVTVMRRHARSRARTLLTAAVWTAGLLAAIAVGNRWVPALPFGWLLLAGAAVALAGAALDRPRGRARRGSQAAHLGLLYLALLSPALATYPLLHAFAASAKERLIAEQYGPVTASQRDDLKVHLARSLEQIDARPGLGDLVSAAAGRPPDAQPAFEIWRATDLDTFRLTSAVELYGADGRLASRFALRLPETAPVNYREASCDWDFLDEVSPFGSSERHVLRASRAVCDGGRRMGAIVVRVMLDYSTLPFIRVESPYSASLGPEREPAAESAPGRDVEFVAYGWSRAPLVTSGAGVWPLADATFDRLVQTREPFWETVERGGVRYRVYFLSDRGGIYALGYPVVSAFGHLVNLAELVVLVGLTYLVLLLGATLLRPLAASGLSGRALLREVRSSFYRKLVAAFVAGAAVPVFVLAVATRGYFAAQARANVEAEALKTVTIAQRLVEDYADIQGRGSGTFDVLDDQIMVIVGRAIDQPVNLFERDRLRATSERDLFASALLTPRTSAAVYRGIVLERLPAFVGQEEVNGSPYLVAAAPVRTRDREGIVTVPQTLRQQEIERQIDELNRRVVSAAVLFALLGAAIGYWMAERIADPVNRLTRATRRIARGDLDARIAATSSDELRRLVEDFNRMAADLKRQRAELERTQRLEAWADMARQVAHDIKNPLTPIQLSAEHARRVNVDRGRPLSPVLDECINAILGQVKLLRQISAEFSSFASSPTANPEPTDLGRLVDEVLDPYRTALSGRIAITTSVDPDLPELLLDRTLFARALTNVIENALHAMPGSGGLSIALSRATDAASVLVEVTDTGVGMDADALARIFEPYFSTKATGTGLGLTIAKRNVELNGGQIGVRSERGVGTTVTITLPCPR
jgi:signal transduction histidine kinase